MGVRDQNKLAARLFIARFDGMWATDATLTKMTINTIITQFITDELYATDIRNLIG